MSGQWRVFVPSISVVCRCADHTTSFVIVFFFVQWICRPVPDSGKVRLGTTVFREQISECCNPYTRLLGTFGVQSEALAWPETLRCALIAEPMGLTERGVPETEAGQRRHYCSGVVLHPLDMSHLFLA
jgi:hypothetical protein